MLLGEKFRSYEEYDDSNDLSDFGNAEQQYSSMLNSPKEARDRGISQIQKKREEWLKVVNEGTAEPDKIEFAKQKLQESGEDLIAVLENCGYSMDEALRRGPDLFRRFIPADDEQIWDKVQRLVVKYGPSHKRTKQALRGAKTYESEAAMVVGINSHMWKLSQQLAEAYGPNHGSVRYVIGLVEDKEAKEAMLVALDPFAFKEFRHLASTLGLDHEDTKQALDAASSEHIRDVFISLIGEQKDQPVPAGAEKAASLQEIEDLLAKEIADLSSANPEYTNKKIERILQSKYHPDINSHPDANAIFQEIPHMLGTQKRPKK